MVERYWIETLGCPKNQVDSEKLAGTLEASGARPAGDAAHADVVVVNTCAFIEAARQESVDTILALASGRRRGSRLVVTGCMAERYGDELRAALPEVDLVAGFGVPVTTPVALGAPPAFDLLNLPRPPCAAPWAYLKVAEGCDRDCGFCAIPSFRGRQRSRPLEAVLAEVDALGPRVREVVLVAQDLASWGLDRSGRTGGRPDGPRPLVELVREVAARVPWVRLLYLYPSGLDDDLVDAMVATGVAYFDLSLQHASRRLLRAMRRPGGADRFLERIAAIRAVAPHAAFRSSFILGYPGETEEDHDELLGFLEAARLDWAGFFTYSAEAGTHAAGLADQVPPELAAERLRECAEVQDAVTAECRARLVGERIEVLVEAPGRARSYREAPEIDGTVTVPAHLAVGEFHPVTVSGSAGCELWAEP